MPLITLKTMKGKPADAIKQTMTEISEVVARNLGYDPAHIWIFTEETEDEHFLTAGRTWGELKPHLYPEKTGPVVGD